MLDSTIVLVSAFIGPICTLIGGYVMLKKYTNPDRIIEIFEDIMTDATENPEIQRKLYLLGGLVGQGIKSGVGLKGGRGKMKLEDLIMQLAGRYIENKMVPQQTSGNVVPQPDFLQQT